MRLIDADKAKEYLQNLSKRYKSMEGAPEDYKDGLADGVEIAIGVLDCRTWAEDAELVRHGRWNTEPYLFGETHRCSLCGENYGMPHGIFKYCPNCGAKMDLEDDDDSEKSS